jgi:hypothetical protein
MDGSIIALFVFLGVCALFGYWRKSVVEQQRERERYEAAYREQLWREQTIARGILRAQEATTNAVTRELDARDQQLRMDQHAERLERSIRVMQGEDEFARLIDMDRSRSDSR